MKDIKGGKNGNVSFMFLPLLTFVGPTDLDMLFFFILPEGLTD